LNKFARLLLSIGVMVVHASADVVLNLSKVVVNVVVALLKSLFGELGDSSSLHGVLILEEASLASKEALEGNDLLEESELGIGLGLRLSLLLGFDGLLDGRVDLGVDL